MSVNKVIILGRLGADPELRYTQSQTAVCTLRMATNERKKGPDGQWTESTEWHRIVTFGKTAENCNQYLKKGRQAYVEGRLRTNKWQDKEGKDRYTTEIIAQTVQFIGGGRSEGIEVERTSSAPRPNAAQIPDAPIGQTVSFDDDDIPF